MSSAQTTAEGSPSAPAWTVPRKRAPDDHGLPGHDLGAGIDVTEDDYCAGMLYGVPGAHRPHHKAALGVEHLRGGDLSASSRPRVAAAAVRAGAEGAG